MSTQITTGNLLNPSATGMTFGMYPAGSMSQYLDSYSVFEATTPNQFGSMPMMGGAISPIGVGGSPVGAMMNNYAYYDLMCLNNDNMTAFQFKQRSNQHALGSYNEIMQKNVQEMAMAIRQGEFGKASAIYNEVYTAISQNYGEEIMTHEQRLNADQSIKATITKLYEQINGYPLVNDIEESGEGFFETGFMQGLTLGNHHKNSAEETISYMTGMGIENYSGKKFNKNVGRVVGGTLSVGGAVAAGALAGSIIPGVGTVIGGAVGGVLALSTWLFSNNSPEKVTEA
ncbi:MAG: hypothetical protein NC200_08025 [Candidatus Gastranaerophilales bacterium]|nr:hypothetical protein [Candidatus Gastranaerophilales bacterium]